MSVTDPPPEAPEPGRAPGPAASGPAASGPTGVVLTALTLVVVAVLVVPVLAAVVHAVRGGGDESGAVGPRVPTGTGAPSAGSGSSSPPTSEPSSELSSESAAPQRSVTCWDGSSAQRVVLCSEPQGAAGLGYVFPSISESRCGTATEAGPAGIVLRQVCRARVDGGQAVVTYYQWPSPDAAVAYVRSKGLTPAGAGSPSGLREFASSSDRQVRASVVYADEPFCYIATLPPGSDPQAGVAKIVSTRPADQVRGAPAG